MTRLWTAIVRVQQGHCVIVRVDPAVLADTAAADGVAQTCCRLRPGLPVVLVSDNPLRPGYYGRHDLVRQVALLEVERLDWRSFPGERFPCGAESALLAWPRFAPAGGVGHADGAFHPTRAFICPPQRAESDDGE